MHVHAGSIIYEIFDEAEVIWVEQVKFENGTIQATWHDAVNANAVNQPRVLKLAVKRAVPAKTSNAKTWLICRPSADWPEVKLPFSQRCSCNEWGLKQPGSAQTCIGFWNNSLQAWLPCNHWEG